MNGYNRFNNQVVALDVATTKELAEVAVTREPIAMAISNDGNTLAAANLLPLARGTDFEMRGELALIDTKTYQSEKVLLSEGSQSLRGVCITPDDRYALIVHVQSNFELVASHVDPGWTNTAALSAVDLVTRKHIGTVLLDDIHAAAANPWAIEISADGKWLCVSHSGTHEVSIVKLAPLLNELKRGPQDRGPMSDASFLVPIRRRIPTGGKGPRGMAMHDGHLFVANYFDDSVTRIDLNDGSTTKIRLGNPGEPNLIRQGEIAFHDASLCYRSWQSCASCHPDARADGLSWDLLNDGTGNLKNTKSMLLAHRTPPAMTMGVRDSAETAVRSGIKHILRVDVDEQVARSIDAYLKSLEPVPSPHLVDGRLSESAQRGKRLFHSQELGCANCHPTDLFADLKRHSMPTFGGERLRIDTPTLIECWRTAPYMHDGRYLTIRELLEEGRHGLNRPGTENLTDQQLTDLVEYVLSL